MAMIIILVSQSNKNIIKGKNKKVEIFIFTVNSLSRFIFGQAKIAIIINKNDYLL